MVQSHIARIAELYDQLAQYWQLQEWFAYVRRGFQERKLPLNGLAGSPGCLGVLDRQELATMF
jgi:hypothetical protein